MRTIQFDTVYQITFMPRLFPINCYMIEEKDDLTLIDTGVEYCGRGILKAADEIGKPIKRILLTHPHADHIGALDYLKERLPQAQVYISERDSALMYGDLSIKDHEENSPIKGGFKKGLKTKADIWISDGHYIGSIRAVSAPGHTPGLMAFFDERSKVLIAGDAFQTQGGLAVAGDKRILFPFPAQATWNKKLAIESAEKLNKLDIKYLAPGHGEVIREPKLLIEKAIKRAEEKLK